MDQLDTTYIWPERIGYIYKLNDNDQAQMT